jgi:drug/metabolite transporter (DMT)-like permease
MSRARQLGLTLLALFAFAGNSLLCRAALAHSGSDAASFTAIRLAAGAAMLWSLLAIRGKVDLGAGHWASALALFAYAAGFSFAYVRLSTATGALLLFGAVQTTMIGRGLWTGERFAPRSLVGLVLALVGFVGLLLPGLSAPPLFGSLLMIGAGVAWGVYSLRGRGAGEPTRETAGNFLRALPFAAALWAGRALTGHEASLDVRGAALAALSGAVTSGLGYAVWYAVLPTWKATTAATLQLAVPVFAALAGVVLLKESVSPRLALTALAILGGVALVLFERQRAAA